MIRTREKVDMDQIKAYHDSPNEEFVLQFFLNPGTGLSNWLTAHKKGFWWLASFSQYLKPQSSLRRPDPETRWSISKEKIYVFFWDTRGDKR